MKRKIIGLFLIIIAIVLVSCMDNPDLDMILEDIQIGYQEGDSFESVTGDLTLPNDDINGVSITWESDNSAITIINDQGNVTRFNIDIEVTLTVTAKYNNESKDKRFVVTIKKYVDIDLDTVINDIDIIYSNGETSSFVTKDIILPNEVEGVDVLWLSNHDAITIDGNKGLVTQQDEDVNVTLTLKVSLNDDVKSKEFVLTVKALESNESIDEAIQSININFTNGDNKDNVTSILTLTNKDLLGYSVEWESNSYAIQIEGDKGYIIRSQEDVNVTLTLKVSSETEERTKEFELVVLKQELEVVKETVSLKYTGSTTAMSADNNAELVNLDPNIFNVTSTKPGNNYAGLNADGTIRLYQPSGGVTLGVKINDNFKITSITFVFGNTVADATIKIGGATYNLTSSNLTSNLIYENLDILEFSIQNSNTANVQIHIKEIIISYEQLSADENTLPEISELDYEVYSTTVDALFNIPSVFASDFFENYLVIDIQTNLNLTQEGVYEVTYSATNEIGKTSKTITIHVFSKDTNLDVTLEVLEEIPTTIYTNEELLLPDALAYDFLGNQIDYTKSHEVINAWYETTFVVTYYATDDYGNNKQLEFIINVVKDPNEEVPIGGDYLPYYDGIDGLSGMALKGELHDIISNMKLRAYNTTSIPLSNTDQSITDPSKVYLIYNGAYVNSTWDSGSTWNKEHVWAKSLFGQSNMSSSHVGIGSDMHNLRAANPTINTSRGNKSFVDGSGNFGAVGSGWYPGDDHIGDVARIILYMHVAWEIEINVGSLDMFLRWHNEDPVDDFEIARNNKIFSYQNNRNPFIDHPQLVSYIWDYS